MVYEYKVKHKGKWYMPGENVPEEDDISTSPGAYTKTDINRMSTSDLQSLATEQGIENAGEISGADLKKILIEHFGL
jgi:hypothetical protein|nr:MAG TPA: Rho termination factor, N-terminal domain [Caudoviricetes sp.]